MPTKNSIFISYRRSDSDYVTGQVYEKLRSHFGPSVVFKDTHSIPLGQDFRKYIDQAIDESQVLIAVIGARWLDALNERTAGNSDDYVKAEIETALAKGDMPVIPLLIEGVTMPSGQDLPESLKDFSYRNAAKVRPALDFNQDVDRL
ncbi:MAG: toll/interleukin-1 receptor domain-containing protein [Cyanobacteria bacterium P01_D01_bin.36]